MAVNNTGGSFLDKLLGFIKAVLHNGLSLPARPVINFVGGVVLDNPTLGTTDVYLSTGGSSGSSISVVQNNGVTMPFEPALDFVGFTLADDPGGSRTTIALPTAGVTDVPHGGTARTSLTSHAVLIGEGASPVGFAVPVSSGFVLTDNGPGADPTFRASPSGLPGGTGIVTVTSGVGGTLGIPLPVADGGTSQTALTSHAVLLGHGTAAVAFAAPVSSGFVLTDNGPGVDPTFQLPSGGFPTPTSNDTSLTFDALAFPSAPHLGWRSKRPCFNIESFGAVGSNASADTAALAAAIAAASAVPGGTVFIPAGPTYLINAEQTVAASIRIIGDRGSNLQAAGSIRSILRLQEDIIVEEISFDANSLASYAILFNGAAHSVVDACDFFNCLVDAWRVQSKSSAATITPGAHSGGGPTLTLSQPDPLYLNLGGSLVIKITTGGSLGTATYQLSVDGGVSYDGVDKVLFSTTQIPVTSPPVLATDSGLRISAPSGTYVLNATYAFTISGIALAANQGISIRSDCASLNCGTVYATAALSADYAGLRTVVAAGSATWTTSSQLVTVAAGGLLAMGARDGDTIRLVGAKFPIFTPASPAQFTDTTTIACVLSDTVLAIDPRALATVAGTGKDYAIGVGWGAGFVDPTTGKENDQVTVTGGHYKTMANGFRDASLNPGGFHDVWLDDYGLGGAYIGTEFSD